MKFVGGIICFCLFATAHGASLRAKVHMTAEPDTSCGKGFDALVPGTQDYFATASVELFTHPGRHDDNATFADELKCWFSNMITSGCGGMPSKYGSRTKDLVATCKDVNLDWIQVWNMFSADEVQFWKNPFPAEPKPTEGQEEGEKSIVNYKEALKTVETVDAKELYCLTLFTIDDECVKYNHI